MYAFYTVEKTLKNTTKSVVQTPISNFGHTCLLPQRILQPTYDNTWIELIISMVTTIQAIPNTTDNHLHLGSKVFRQTVMKGKKSFHYWQTTQITSETPETLLHVSLQTHIHCRVDKIHKLSLRNRILLSVMWS